MVYWVLNGLNHFLFSYFFSPKNQHTSLHHGFPVLFVLESIDGIVELTMHFLHHMLERCALDPTLAVIMSPLRSGKVFNYSSWSLGLAYVLLSLKRAIRAELPQPLVNIGPQDPPVPKCSSTEMFYWGVCLCTTQALKCGVFRWRLAPIAPIAQL